MRKYLIRKLIFVSFGKLPENNIISIPYDVNIEYILDYVRE
jgi:hypothetical protein